MISENFKSKNYFFVIIEVVKNFTCKVIVSFVTSKKRKEGDKVSFEDFGKVFFIVVGVIDVIEPLKELSIENAVGKDSAVNRYTFLLD